MHCVQSLPEDYRKIYEIDLQKNKKTALLLNILGSVMGILMVLAMHFVIPIGTLFSMENGFADYCLRFVVLIVGIIVYIILHEWVHGRVMRFYGARQVKFGFTGLYAFAGSKEDYFAKKAYIVIALAPLVLWGVVLLAVNLLVGEAWFWVVYWIQVMNVTGAVGDLFVTVKFSKMPVDILVNDDGVSMRVYLPEG